MKIAILSGKGGTGKTFISVNLANIVNNSLYIDCDIEEPNGHLFFDLKDIDREPVNVKIPVVDDDLCNGCRICVDFCKFNALAYINEKLIIFDDICHSCGGCTLFCPEKALHEIDKEIGRIEKGLSNSKIIYTGILNIGEPSGVPIIENLMDKIDTHRDNDLAIIDCPPGNACTVMETVKAADYCIIVAEPSIFGVHNLDMALQLVNIFNKPVGIVLNKCLPEANPAEEYCITNNIRILAKIPFDKELGRLNADGYMISDIDNMYKDMFKGLLDELLKGDNHEAVINP